MPRQDEEVEGSCSGKGVVVVLMGRYIIPQKWAQHTITVLSYAEVYAILNGKVVMYPFVPDRLK